MRLSDRAGVALVTVGMILFLAALYGFALVLAAITGVTP